MDLLIAFQNPKLYNYSNLKRLNLENKKLFLICPYDFIYFFFLLRNKILLKPFDFFRKKTKTHLNENISKLEIKTLKPGFLDIIYFFPVSLLRATINTINLIKILRGDVSHLYSNGIDITGYCLDSLQRFFGKKFLIEEENSISNIIISFIYLLLLEIYTNWFFSKLKKKTIIRAIVNHNEYAESGLFAEYSQLLHGSKIYLCQSSFKDNVKFDNNRMDIMNYITNLENSNNIKDLPWATSDAITEQEGLASKKIDLSRVLVVMHCFGDANHIHTRFGYEPLFKTYYHWIKKTLEIARSLKNQFFIFRTHPISNTFYINDKLVLLKLFKNLPKNIKLEDTAIIKNSLHHFKKNIPIIVTYKGMINLEMGCSGIKVVELDVRKDDLPELIPNSLKEYREILEGKIDPARFYLKNDQIIKFKKVKQKLLNFTNPKMFGK